MVPALVLTAGIGARLDPITRLVAKPAVPLAGQPLIERVLAGLVRRGVTDTVLNLHHRPESITAVVGDGAHLGVRVRYSWEGVLLGSAGGPRHALSLLGGDAFLIVNGDTWCDVNLATLLAAHQTTGADVTLAVVPAFALDRYGSIEADASGRIGAFRQKGALTPGWHFVGVQVVRASVFAALPDNVPAETIAGLYRERLEAGADLRVWQTDASFVDVGTPADYLEAARRLGTTGSIVWPEARIATGAVLEDCIVAGRVEVPASLRARR